MQKILLWSLFLGAINGTVWGVGEENMGDAYKMFRLFEQLKVPRQCEFNDTLFNIEHAMQDMIKLGININQIRIINTKKETILDLAQTRYSILNSIMKDPDKTSDDTEIHSNMYVILIGIIKKNGGKSAQYLEGNK